MFTSVCSTSAMDRKCQRSASAIRSSASAGEDQDRPLGSALRGPDTSPGDGEAWGQRTPATTRLDIFSHAGCGAALCVGGHSDEAPSVVVVQVVLPCGLVHGRHLAQ